jgi:hypothetical protein
MAEDLIRYDVLAQDALRGLVRKVLSEVAHTGLPGDHHFFITFDTRHPGARLSSRVRAQYPGEMTIVLQHQFWDLKVTEQAFEVGLSFKGVPEHVHIPFEAITSFVDPHASFGLKFDPEARLASAPGEQALRSPAPITLPTPLVEPTPAEPEKPQAPAGVVSLDAFRKKNN